MNIAAWHWPKQQQMTEQYLHQFDRVETLFDYDPWNEQAWRARAEWLDESRSGHSGQLYADRAALADVLVHYQQQIGAPEEAVQAAGALRETETLTMVGGQQACLFTGPALVIWKAITLIQSAKQAEERLQRRVVPVFWIAGEDHDWDEVSHVYLTTRDMTVEKYKLPDVQGAGRAQVSDLAVSEEVWREAIHALDESLIDTEFKQEILQQLVKFSADSASLTEHFARTITWLFGKYGLVLMDSAAPLVRQLSSPMFAALIEQHHEINQALLQGGEAVAAHGFPLQASVAEDQVNLFFIHEGERRLLIASDGRFTDKKAELSFTKDQLLALCDASPERFSNNALTRPLMQEYLFPVLGTILGPSEIAYWGLLKQAFQQVQMKMPILVPRYEYTLLEGTIQKHMRKYELTVEDVILKFADRKQAWLEQQDELQLEERFAQVKDQFIEMYSPLLDTVSTLNNGMKKLGETNMQKILEQLDFMRQRSLDAHTSQFEAAIRQLDRIALSVLPLGKPQERLYNIFMYLNKYGFTWLDQMVAHMPADVKRHNFVYF